MDKSDNEKLLNDPEMPWDAGCPYEYLNARLQAAGHPGIGPESSAKDIKDALFDLMATGRPSQQDRVAWDELRLLDRRLLVDFFLYRAEALDPTDLDSLLRDRPVPLELPDFLQLADVTPDLTKALEIPDAFDPGPKPVTVPIEPSKDLAPPLDFGPLLPDLKTLLEEDDDW